MVVPRNLRRLARVLQKVVASGKVRAVGISINRWEPNNGVKAVRAGLFDAVQVIYNIFEQEPAAEFFPVAEANKVGVIVRVPLDELLH